MAVIFPDSILVSTNKPLDDKTLKKSILERDNIPVSLRYKGLVIAVQNEAGRLATYYNLPTDDLSNDGWQEISFSSSHEVLIYDWISGKPYSKRSIVLNDSIIYRCVRTHISLPTFEQDKVNWEVVYTGVIEHQHPISAITDLENQLSNIKNQIQTVTDSQYKF